jgi:hypothetical protein
MSAPLIHTYADVLDRLRYFATGQGVGADQTLMRMCVEESYREITQARHWSCLEANARIQLRAPQTTGTVVFDLTGHASGNDRVLTLTDATWPEAWVKDASIRLGSPEIVCDVEDYLTSTTITLDATMSPIADVSSTTYSLYPRWYALPNDFLSMDLPMDEESWILGEESTKAEIERLQRYNSATGNIQQYAVAQVPDLYGTMGLFIYPASDESETLDIPYRRRPRAMVYSGLDGTIDCAGTVTLTSGSASVTGSSTAFESGMAGAILRVATGTVRPTGTAGQVRYAEQYSIKSVESATALTLTSDATTSRSDKAYSISDPVDVDAAVYDALMACCEKNLARMMRAKNMRDVEMAFEKALRVAKAADHRGHQPVIAGAPRRRGSRPADSSTSTRNLVTGLD